MICKLALVAVCLLALGTSIQCQDQASPLQSALVAAKVDSESHMYLKQQMVDLMRSEKELGRFVKFIILKYDQKDHDGTINKEEYSRFIRALYRDFGYDGAETNYDAQFDMDDVNGDGKLSKEEFRSTVRNAVKMLYTKSDDIAK